MRNVLTALFFLSSVAVATSASAKGMSNDVYIGGSSSGITTKRSGNYTVPCINLGYGRLSSGSTVRCFTSMEPLDFPKPKKSFKKQPPIPHLIDVSNILSKTRWIKDDLYFAPTVKEEETAISLLAVPAALAIGSILIVFVMLNDWAPYEEKNNSDEKTTV